MLAGSICDLASTAGGSYIAAVLQSQSDAAGCLQIWQAESAPPEAQYTLDAHISLSDSPTAVTWLPSCAVNLAVAVACFGGVQIFSQSHGYGWGSIAKLGNMGQPMRALQLDCNGLPVVTAGNQLGIVSNLVQALSSSPSSTSPSQLLQIPLGQLVLELGGPLPDYAPAAVALQIARGRMHAAREAFCHLLSWLKIHNSSVQSQSSNASPLDQQLLPDAPLDALLDKPYILSFSSLVHALPFNRGPAQPQDRPSSAAKFQPQQKAAGGRASVFDTAQHAGSTSSSRPGPQPQSTPTPAPADPFAFDAGAFGISGTGDDEEEQQEASSAQPAAAKDPFAFDAGAFGLGDGADEEQGEQQASPAAASAVDPYAFDAGAFGSHQEEEEAQHQPAQAASDPFAFDAGAFGMSPGQPEEDEQEEKQAASQPAAVPADPFAFDLGAFGLSGEELPAQQATASASATASAADTDPFAFNPDAFGFGGQPQPEEDEEGGPQIAPAEASGQDPFAFNAGAFGMDVSPEPQSNHKDDQHDQHKQPMQPGTDAFAFDPGAFGMHPSTSPAPQPQPPASAAKAQTAAKAPLQHQQARGNQINSGTSGLGRSSVQHHSPAVQLHRPKPKASSSSRPAVLSSSELGDLQKLLGTALSCVAGPDPDMEPVSPSSHVGDHTDPTPLNPPSSALPPGLTPGTTHTLLGIAQMLCDDPPQPAPSSSQQGVAVASGQGLPVPGIDHIPVDWPALDEAAQKAVRAVQLAVCSMQSNSGVFNKGWTMQTVQLIKHVA